MKLTVVSRWLDNQFSNSCLFIWQRCTSAAICFTSHPQLFSLDLSRHRQSFNQPPIWHESESIKIDGAEIFFFDWKLCWKYEQRILRIICYQYESKDVTKDDTRDDTRDDTKDDTKDDTLRWCHYNFFFHYFTCSPLLRLVQGSVSQPMFLKP